MNIEYVKAELRKRVARDVQHYPPGEVAIRFHQQIRERTLELANLYIELCPPSRELSLALTKLVDEAMAHANAAVARNHDQLPTVADLRAAHPDESPFV